MRIYISGPITGIPNFKEIFDKAEEKLKAEFPEAEIINPAMVVLPASCTHEDYMRIDLMLLDLADAIYLLKGWDKSKGDLHRRVFCDSKYKNCEIYTMLVDKYAD